MITFNKINEFIEKNKNSGGHLLIRRLSPSKILQESTDEEIIDSVIKSKFHFWKGEEEPDGQTIQMSKKDSLGKLQNFTLTNQKFYGFYDNNKIHFSNYKPISRDTLFKEIATVSIELFESDNSFDRRIANLIEKNLNPLVSIYHLDLDERTNSDLIAEWHVYTFFKAFMFIDKKNDTVSIIEFGQD